MGEVYDPDAPDAAQAASGKAPPTANVYDPDAPSSRVYDAESPLVASPWDVGVASFANDPQSRLRYYANEMGVPESELAVSNGNIFARGEDGRYYNIEAGTMNQIAKGLGPSMPAVGGAIGGILGMPLGPAGAAGGGITGAASGQGAREALSSLIMDQEPSGGRIVFEAGLDLASTVAGLLVGKGLTKAAATKAGKELNSMLSSGGMAAMDALEEVLKRVNTEYGTNIRLTPAELSNFYKNRAGESDAAFGGMLNKEFGPDVSPDVAGGRLVQNAQQAEKQLTKDVSDQGSPLYTRAFAEAEAKGGVNIKPVVDFMLETERKFPSAADGIKQLRDMVMTVEQRNTPSGVVDHVKYENNLEVLQDGVKETLDDLISAAVTSGKGKLASRYMKIKNKLLSELDTQVPSYGVARQNWTKLMSEKGLAEGGMIPSLAGKKLKDFEEMGRLFFSGSSPSEIGRVRQSILKTDAGAENWNGVLRGYLDQQWSKAGRVYKSQLSDPTKAGVIQPLTFWADMVGDARQMARLKSAMTTTQWEAFKRLADVFEATGRASNFNSTTVRQSAGKEMLEPASWGGEIAKTVVNFNPLSILSRAQEGVQKIINEGNVSRIVDVLTNGESIKELLKISTQNTSRDKAALIAAKALNIARTQGEAHYGPED